MNLFGMEVSLAQINSWTKYPSIECYHPFVAVDGRKRPEMAPVAEPPPDRALFVTEKIDGTNARIILFDGRWFIGGRESLLRAKGDMLYDPNNGVAEGLADEAERYSRMQVSGVFGLGMHVVYGEFYGRRVNAYKSYTDDSTKSGFRAFDFASFQWPHIEELLAMSEDQVVGWRSRWLPFVRHPDIVMQQTFSHVPKLDCPSPPPTDIRGAYEWLKNVVGDTTKAAVSGVSGKPEGVVIRTVDRLWIRKLRLEDYERALRVRNAATKGAAE